VALQIPLFLLSFIHKQPMPFMTQDRIDDIQRMFERMGLGKPADRQRLASLGVLEQAPQFKDNIQSQIFVDVRGDTRTDKEEFDGKLA
jgi:hypothetical protein